MPKDLLTLLADSEDGIYGVDMEHRVVLWNDAAQRLLGWTADEVLGKRCFEVLQGQSEHVGDCAPNCPVILKARRFQVPAGQTVFTHDKSGAARWIFIAHIIAPSERPELSVLVHIMRDATTEVEAKQLLQSLSRFVELSPPSPESNTEYVTNGAYSDLSPRELEVLSLLAQGYGTDNIADRLFLSKTTVRNHVQRILAKLEVHTRVEAVSYAFRHGLLADRRG